MHTFRIKARPSLADCSIELDGKPLDGVARASFDLSAGEQPARLRLELIGHVIVDGEFQDTSIVKVEQPVR